MLEEAQKVVSLRLVSPQCNTALRRHPGRTYVSVAASMGRVALGRSGAGWLGRCSTSGI